jgi:hypothetical protein
LRDFWELKEDYGVSEYVWLLKAAGGWSLAPLRSKGDDWSALGMLGCRAKVSSKRGAEYRYPLHVTIWRLAGKHRLELIGCQKHVVRSTV